ncbi:MAG: metal-dependent transcriptional regulator [Candidatus Diapherotrites archaeon]|uniref:Metal-dependent transcriptional regulator n=1 Tax=Candidatus Iainarchaeum sp. TaxID=3101447 RepID=A0A8T3YJR5_9ARCH|nr:metal-dependent transcriptional regulator [Candidatus Diapherotrites archaeon]
MPVIEEKIILEKSHENEEMYLKAIWLLEEAGVKPIHASDAARLLKISLPSATEMLGRMEAKKLVSYGGREGITLMPAGRKTAEKIVRNLRLTELLFRDVLKIDYRSDSVCRLEHAITDEVAEAIRKLLGNPRECPHGKIIPRV